MDNQRVLAVLHHLIASRHEVRISAPESGLKPLILMTECRLCPHAASRIAAATARPNYTAQEREELLAHLHDRMDSRNSTLITAPGSGLPPLILMTMSEYNRDYDAAQMEQYGMLVMDVAEEAVDGAFAGDDRIRRDDVVEEAVADTFEEEDTMTLATGENPTEASRGGVTMRTDDLFEKCRQLQEAKAEHDCLLLERTRASAEKLGATPISDRNEWKLHCPHCKGSIVIRPDSRFPVSFAFDKVSEHCPALKDLARGVEAELRELRYGAHSS